MTRKAALFTRGFVKKADAVTDARPSRFYLDMDGVMADYEKAANEQGIPLDEFKDHPGSFRHLEPMEGAIDAVIALLERHGDDLWILSTPPKDRVEESCQEKRDWLTEHIPAFPLERALFVQDKGEESMPGDRLVDDHPDWHPSFKGTIIPFTGPETWEEILGGSAKTAAPKVDLNAMVDEFMNALGAQEVEWPKIQMVNRSNVSWLGICNTTYNMVQGWVEGCSSVLSIQKGVMADLNTARRVVAHEVAHHVCHWELVSQKSGSEAQANLEKEGQHGEHFFAVAARLNAAYGEGFVTKTSDESYSFEKKEVNLFVLIMPNKDIVHWVWSTQVPEKLVDIMVEYNRQAAGIGCFIGKTTSRFLVLPQAKFNPANPSMWLKVETQEQWTAMEDAFQKSANEFPSYASRVKAPTPKAQKRWTLVMADPKRGNEGHPRWINAWAIARVLTTKEIHLLQQLGDLGTHNRVVKMNGDEDLFKNLDKFLLDTLVYHSGLAEKNVLDPDVQERLRELWATAQPMTKAAASGWGAEADKFQGRQEGYEAKQVYQGVLSEARQLLESYKVKPRDKEMSVLDYLKAMGAPVTTLFQLANQKVYNETTKALLLYGNKFRTELDAYMKQTYTPQQIQSFKSQFGNTAADWFLPKRSSLRSSKAACRMMALDHMKLARANDDLLLKRYEQAGLTKEGLEVAKQVDDGDYLEWVIRQWLKAKSIKLPEDAGKLKEQLAVFTKLKRSPRFQGNKDINSYDPATLFETLSGASGQTSEKEQKRERYSGATIWAGKIDHPNLGTVAVELLKITDVQSAMELSGGSGVTQEGKVLPETNWCTVGEQHAEHYLGMGPLYVIKVNGRNYCQINEGDGGQCKDVKDDEFDTFTLNGERIVKDAVVNGVLVQSGVSITHFDGFDPNKAEPENLVDYYFGVEQFEPEDVPPEFMAKIMSSPTAVAHMVCHYKQDETPEMVQVILTTPLSAAEFMAKHLDNKQVVRAWSAGATLETDDVMHYQGDTVGYMDAALKVVLQDPETSGYVAEQAIRKGAVTDPAKAPGWFTLLLHKTEEDPRTLTALLHAIPRWPGLADKLAHLNPYAAMLWWQRSNPWKRWEELEGVILDRKDQDLACEYLRITKWLDFDSDTVPSEQPLMQLALSTVPTDDKGLKDACALIYHRLQELNDALFKGQPIPADVQAKMFPAAAWPIVQKADLPGIYAMWAAKCLQENPEELHAAWMHMVKNMPIDAIYTYLKYARYAPVHAFEERMAKETSGIYSGDLYKYVEANYESKLNPAHQFRDGRGDELTPQKVLLNAIRDRNHEPSMA